MYARQEDFFIFFAEFDLQSFVSPISDAPVRVVENASAGHEKGRI
jgi:hypothetical protein